VPTLDLVVVILLALGAARGLAIGLVREAFSFAGVGAALFAVWQFGDAATAALAPHVGGSLPPAAVHALAVAGLGFGVLLAVTVVGRLVRRSIQFAGLGVVDRLAGGCLGALEGALVAAVLLGAATYVLSPGHPWLVQSQAVAVFERARTDLTPPGGALPADVAAPARRDVAAPARR
jgi:uncharacterized membrane protein required for colicin V production